MIFQFQVRDLMFFLEAQETVIFNTLYSYITYISFEGRVGSGFGTLNTYPFIYVVIYVRYGIL